MVQPRPQAIDSLWQCLCPSFDRYALSPSLHRLRATSLLPSKHRRTKTASRSIVTVIPSHPKPVNFWKPKHIGKPTEPTSEAPSTPWSRRAEQQSKELGQDQSINQTIQSRKKLLDSTSNDIRTLPNDRIHAILQREAHCAYHDRVYEIVEILIRERGERPDKIHYNALISTQANLEHGSSAEVERLLQEMQESGIELDAGICSAVLKALAVHPHYMLRCHIIKEMENSWFALSSEDHQHIAAGLLRELQFELAWDRLNTMQAQGFTPDPWLLNLFMFSLSSINCWSEVHSLLKNVHSNPEHRIPGALWSHLLHSATKEQYQPLVADVWNRAVKTGYINPSSGLCTMVLESCAAHGDSTLAADVFRVLGERSSPLQIWHYESLLEAYIVSGDLEGVISTVHIMSKAGFPLNTAITRSLYTYFRESPDMVADALGLLSSPSLNTQYPPPLALLNVILESMVQQGDLSAAIDTFHSLKGLTPEPANLDTFNVLFQGCTIAARKDVAMSLAWEMRQRSIIPNALTYDRLILVCLSTNNKADLDDAWRYYDELRAATPSSNNPVEVQRWGLRRGTVKALTASCVQYQDERAFGLLDQCLKEGMDVSMLRQSLEKDWQQKWGHIGFAADAGE